MILTDLGYDYLISRILVSINQKSEEQSLLHNSLHMFYALEMMVL